MTAALIIVPLFIVLLAAYLLTIALTSEPDDSTDSQPQVIWTQAGKVAPGNGLMKR